MTWDEEAVTILRNCAVAGKTFAETARLIGGGCTRNMVAGKAKRLGVSFNAERTAKQSRANRATAFQRWADPAFRAREQERRRAQRVSHV